MEHITFVRWMKKFLLISYYWPPTGGGGVMRWLKMSKYIGEAGWEPIVYTHEDGEMAVEDNSLVQEVPPHLTIVRRPIWEPYKLYKAFLGRKKNEKLYSGFINPKKKSSLSQKVSVWIRGNFFIPDARMFWIKPSIRFLKEYVKENPVEAIISTGPPHSMHMIARGLHKATGIPWISDFRDPWTNIDFYQELNLTSWADAKHRRLEKKVLKDSTKIVAVTWRSKEEFIELIGRDDIEVITNGYDPADFPKENTPDLDHEFTIVHFGSMNKDRNPLVCWKAIHEILNEHPEIQKSLRIRLYGPVDFQIKESIEQHQLLPYTTFIDYVPHAEVVKLQQKAQLVLLIINNTPNSRTIIPGKLYEYLGSARPILAIGPKDSDSAHVIQLTKAGEVFEYDEKDRLKKWLLEQHHAYKMKALHISSTDIEQFSRQNLAHQYAALLNQVTKKS